MNQVRVPEDRSVLPITTTAVALAEIWFATFMIDNIGVHDNFVKLGGDSVSDAQFLNRVQAFRKCLEGHSCDLQQPSACFVPRSGNLLGLEPAELIVNGRFGPLSQFRFPALDGISPKNSRAIDRGELGRFASNLRPTARERSPPRTGLDRQVQAHQRHAGI